TAQPGDVRPDGADRRAWRFVVPESVDQLGDRDLAAVSHEEDREHRALLRRAEIDLLPATPGTERSEDGEPGTLSHLASVGPMAERRREISPSRSEFRP